ncbi:MAG: ketopantoate reductase family protein [Candidatus Zixiibacteriota bacterium]
MTEKSDDARLRVGVIGMGPTGSGLTAHFIDAGAFVVPCDIDREKIDLIKKEGVRLENTIQKEVSVEEACYSVQELKEYDLDLVVVSVKTPNLKKVVSIISEIVPEDAYVMCAQNGLDNEQEVAEILGDDRTLRMAVNFAGSMSSPNTVNVMFFNSPNYISALTKRGEAIANRIVKMLNSVDLKTEVSADFRDHAWEKAILNSALSPVCAITKLTMKDVMDSPDGLALVKAIIDESLRVAEAEGISLKRDFREFSINYLKGAGYHRPSMLVDLDNGLLTEIDYLNGRIAEYGRKHNLPTPVNQTITCLVHMMEHSAK